MKKKVLLGAAALLLLFLAAAFLYDPQYEVEPDNSNLADLTVEFLDHGNGNTALYEPLYLYDTIDMGDRRVVLMEIGPELDLGEVHLIRGLNGKYRIDSAGWGTGNFRERVLEVDGASCWFIGGRNTDCRIGKITVEFDGETYTVDVPEQERFLVSVELKCPTKREFANGETLRFYDRTGADITESILRN